MFRRLLADTQRLARLREEQVAELSIAWPVLRQAVVRIGAALADRGAIAVIAREYGIPAVVGCGDATARLRTGMHVTVNGATGTIEPA